MDDGLALTMIIRRIRERKRWRATVVAAEQSMHIAGCPSVR